MYFKQFSDAQDCYKELMKALDVAKVSTDKKMMIQKEAQRALDFFKKAKAVYNDPKAIEALTPKKIEVPKIPDRNKRYPAMANCVEFRYFK